MTPHLESIPEPLQALAVRAGERLLERCNEDQRAILGQQLDEPDSPLLKLLACCQVTSDYIGADPGGWCEFTQQGQLQRPWSAEDLRALMDAALTGCDDEPAFNQALRKFRNLVWLRIVYRDVNDLATVEQTMAELSWLADLSVQRALAFHQERLCRRFGEPGTGARMVVLGMGKLGAGELNLSSDIDLIFAYSNGGTTTGDNPIDNQQYFIRLGQKLVDSIGRQTVDGFVFRVDMRLRPYGQSGPLAMSFDAMEDYYQDQGREWERYAMIKARCIAGDEAAGETLLDILQPFVYRRYIDYSVIDALRDMKARIRRELQIRKLGQNLKLGEGGIREIEFTVQCMQLIRGGQEPALRCRELQTVLQVLPDLGLMPREDTDALLEDYRFLRRAEHAVQAWKDQQTQELPDEPEAKAALALVMGFGGDVDAFDRAIKTVRKRVSSHFDEVVSKPGGDTSYERAGEAWYALVDKPEPAAACAMLAEHGFEAPEQSVALLQELLDSDPVQRLAPTGRDRLLEFLPELLEELPAAEQPSRALARILPMVEAVLRRSNYLVLLLENPQALRELVYLCDASRLISRELATHPVLLEELVDTGQLYDVPSRAGLQQDMRQQLLRVAEDDLEQQMEALRYFRLAHVLRVAASEVTGRLPLMRVSDYLSVIAEVVLEQVLQLCWKDLTERYGLPGGMNVADDLPFAIVAYGKLGGLELGHGSDLDLVFIHGGDPMGTTRGPKSIDNATFFVRLGQRLIHMLSTRTRLGVLYETDMRLRPSGNSGLLVIGVNGFRDYQHVSAWTWEHQALLRARVVAGGASLAAAINDIRAEILSRPRDLAEVTRDVADMREKMRAHLLPTGTETADNPVFDVKQGHGGIVDIEFMVQHQVLVHASQHPELLRYTDNIRILETLGQCGLWREADVEAVIDAYKIMRSHLHRLSLQGEERLMPIATLEQERDAVQARWRGIFRDNGN